MSTPFDTLTALRDEWHALQPLSAENEARLWKKLRLEWNYHSNHIEGNTLTYGETELLLMHDRTTGNHSHREYLEMKAHNVGIEHVRTLAADKTHLITEGDIRDLNKIILKESFWKPAETADGLPTRKEIIPGQYKTTPNNVRLPNGDIFPFASVDDTPPKMQALSAWMQQELESPTLHPVAFAAKLHHDFVVIHPFDDGNGRVARLLVNCVLMRSGYLPIIVRTDDKANYLTALHLADAGELSALIRYFHQLAESSIHLGIKAAKGEAIEEPSDVEKEIAIFIRDQQDHQNKVKPLSSQVLRELYDIGLRDLIECLATKLGKLDELFTDHKVSVLPNGGSDAIFALMRIVSNPQVNRDLQIHHHFHGYRGKASAPFDIDVTIWITFGEFQYSIGVGNQNHIRRLYSEPLLRDEAIEIAQKTLTETFAEIKKLASSDE
jgi:Fic family protein